MMVYDQLKPTEKVNPAPGPLAVANNRVSGYSSYKAGKVYFSLTSTEVSRNFSDPSKHFNLNKALSKLRKLEGYVGSRKWGGFIEAQKRRNRF